MSRIRDSGQCCSFGIAGHDCRLDAAKKWFYENLYLGNVNGGKKIAQSRNFNCISEREKQYLNLCAEDVRHFITENDIDGSLLKKYNNLCHAYFKAENNALKS